VLLPPLLLPPEFLSQFLQVFFPLVRSPVLSHRVLLSAVQRYLYLEHAFAHKSALGASEFKVLRLCPITDVWVIRVQ